MIKYRYSYTVTWGEGQSQKCQTKTEAIKIAANLLGYYGEVSIKRNKEY